MDPHRRFLDPRLAGNPTIGTALWLIQLRWVAVVGQWLAVGITHWGLGIHLPLKPLIALITITAASNAIYRWVVLRRTRSSSTQPHDTFPVSSAWLGSILILDVLILTGLLYFTGGIANPFSSFYLANIIVGGLILSAWWTWTLTGLTILCAAYLLGYAPPLVRIGIDFDPQLAFFSVPKQGALIALTTCSTVVAYFMNVLVGELRRSESRLAESEQQRAAAQRLEALATLAAGAGHELASPLSTIAVVAKELSRKIEKTDAMTSIRRDVDLIRSELDRCRDVLKRMQSGAGEAAAERMHQVTVIQLVEMILGPLRQPERVEVVIEPALKQENHSAATSSRHASTAEPRAKCARCLGTHGESRDALRKAESRMVDYHYRSWTWNERRCPTSHWSTLFHHQRSWTRNGVGGLLDPKRFGWLGWDARLRKPTGPRNSCRVQLPRT